LSPQKGIIRLATMTTLPEHQSVDDCRRSLLVNLLVENRKIFILHLYLAPRNFVTMFDADKTTW